MGAKTKMKCQTHDFIAPKGETQDSEARCAQCGAEPTTAELQMVVPIRYVDPATWFDVMVRLG
jgi:hypothetical protein